MANGGGYGWALAAGFNAALAAISAKFFSTLVPRHQPTPSSLSTALTSIARFPFCIATAR